MVLWNFHDICFYLSVISWMLTSCCTHLRWIYNIHVQRSSLAGWVGLTSLVRKSWAVIICHKITKWRHHTLLQTYLILSMKQLFETKAKIRKSKINLLPRILNEYSNIFGRLLIVFISCYLQFFFYPWVQGEQGRPWRKT